jgi:uncharacterized protein (TIGR02118 family)
MIKILGLIKRLPHLSFKEFDDHWRLQHGPLIRSYAEILRIKRYIQTPMMQDEDLQARIRTSRGSLESSFDGLAELWCDSIEDMLAARGTEEGKAALRAIVEDEHRFIDLSRCQFWYGTERPYIA